MVSPTSVLGGVAFNIEANTRQAVRRLDRLGDSLQNLSKDLRRSAQSAQRAESSFDDLEGAVGQVGLAFGTLKLAEFGAEATKLAARAENLKTVLENVGGIAGKSAAEIQNIENSVKDLGITTQKARESVTLLGQAELDLANAAQLARIAQDAAVIAGTNSSEAFRRLVVAIQRNDSRLLRNLGIVINLNQVYSKFTQQTNRTITSLTAMEKRQLVLNEVIEKGQVIAGTYEAAMTDVFKRFTSMDRLVEEATRTFGKQYIPVFEVAVDKTSEFLKNFAEDEAFISQKAAGSVATFTVTIGALTTALTAATAAGRGFLLTFGGTGAGLAVLGVSAAIAGLVTAAQQAEAETKRFRDELKALEDDAAAATVKITEARGLAPAIVDLAEKEDRTAAETRRLIRLIKEFSAEVPELEQSLGRLTRQQKFQAVASEIQARAAETLRTNEEALQRQQERRASFEEQLRGRLKKLGSGVVNVRQDELAGTVIDRDLERLVVSKRVVKELETELGRDLRGGLPDVAEDLELTRKELVAIERAIQKVAPKDIQERFSSLASNLDTGRLRAIGISVSGLAKELLRLDKVIEETKFANIRDQFKAGQELAEATRTTAAQARKQVKILNTAREKEFKDTNAEIIIDLENFLRRVQGKHFQTEEEITEFIRVFTKKQRRIKQQQTEERFEQLEAELKAAKESGEGIAEVQRKIAKANQDLSNSFAAVEKEATDLQANLISELKTINEGFEASIELTRIRNEELEKSVNRLREQLALLEEGIDPAIATKQKKIQRAFEDSAKGIEKNLEILNRVTAQLGGVVDTGTRDELLATQQLALETLRKSREEALLQARIGAKETQQTIQSRLDQIGAELQRSNNKILKLRDQFATRSIRGLERLADEQKRNFDDVADFITKRSQDLRDDFAPGIRQVEDLFDEFSEKIKRAQTDEQLDLLAAIFPKEARRLLEGLTEDLDKAQESLDEFLESRNDKIRRKNLELQDLQDRLIRGGASRAGAAQTVRRERQEFLQELNEREQELRGEVERRERGVDEAQRQTQQFRASFEEREAFRDRNDPRNQRTVAERLRDLIKERRQDQEFLVNAQEKLSVLKQKELDTELKQNEVLRNRIETLKKINEQVQSRFGGGKGKAELPDAFKQDLSPRLPAQRVREERGRTIAAGGAPVTDDAKAAFSLQETRRSGERLKELLETNKDTITVMVDGVEQTTEEVFERIEQLRERQEESRQKANRAFRRRGLGD